MIHPSLTNVNERYFRMMVLLQSSTMARAGSISSKEWYEKKRPAVAARLSPGERAELRRIAELNGKSTSDVVREALFAYLGTDVSSWEKNYQKSKARTERKSGKVKIR